MIKFGRYICFHYAFAVLYTFLRRDKRRSWKNPEPGQPTSTKLGFLIFSASFSPFFGAPCKRKFHDQRIRPGKINVFKNTGCGFPHNIFVKTLRLLLIKSLHRCNVAYGFNPSMSSDFFRRKNILLNETVVTPQIRSLMPARIAKAVSSNRKYK